MSKKEKVNVSKRVHVIAGTKGGVGKSFCASLLADYFVAEKIDAVLVDADPLNPTFRRFWPSAAQLDPRAVDQLDDVFLRIFEGGQRIAVVDLGAGKEAEVLTWMKDVPFDELASVHGVHFTTHLVVSADRDAVVAALVWAEAIQDQTKYLVWATEKDGPAWGFDRTEQGQSFVAAFSPAIVRVPRLEPAGLRAALEQRVMSVGRAAEMTESVRGLSDVISRQRLRRFRDGVFEQLAGCADDFLFPPRACLTGGEAT